MDTDDEYQKEYEYIESEFPNAKFSICIPMCDLDNVISNEKTIIIRRNYYCYCYDMNDKKRDHYVITHDNMTYRNVIHEMIRQDISFDCNHRFLEAIEPTHKDNHTQFQFSMGS